jgi:hypothetical protein
MVQQINSDEDISDGELLHAPVWFVRYDHKGKKIVFVIDANSGNPVNGIGLDPYYGFFHVTHNSFQALVYDLIEPFRWLVEYAVYKIGTDRNHEYRISKNDYVWA